MRATPPRLPVPSQSDLFCLLVGAVRYALGRRSYVVGQTVEIVERLGPALSRDQLAIIRRDIREATKAARRWAELGKGTLGDRIDHVAWVRLARRLPRRARP